MQFEIKFTLILKTIKYKIPYDTIHIFDYQIYIQFISVSHTKLMENQTR